MSRVWGLRRLVYRLGFRPRLGSILYSPTLDWHYAFRTFSRDFERAMNEARNR